jgi:hypothetical protein
MTTDRTQPARSAALNDRSSAAPAERRDGSAFAALLDAHAPAPRREEAPRGDRGAEPRTGHDQPRDAGLRHEHAAAGHDAHRDQQPAAPEVPSGQPGAQPSSEHPVPAQAGPVAQPVIVPPFVATAPVEAPVAPAPLFMLAPEAVAAAASPLPPQVTAPSAPSEAPVVAAPVPGTPIATPPPAPAQPAATAPGEAAPAAAQPHHVGPAPAAPQALVPEGEPPTEPVASAPAAPAAPEAHAAAPARTAAASEPAPTPAPAVQAPTTDSAAPAPISTPVSGLAAPERAVPLHRAPAAVSTLLHVAVERGITHARMALRPAELGGIEIRLQATAGGIAAQVVADSPEAARLLAQAGDDLRRALEARDVTLISLEVSTSGDQHERRSARGEWNDSDPTSPGRAAGDADGDAEPVPTTQTVIELPGGLLVDVLA